ncbi:MAG: hypothetical protein WD793_10830 [Steroidobacteraceae bacterium]
MKNYALPETLARVNDELQRRHAAGLSDRLTDFGVEILRDDRVGLFLRITITLADGDQFTLDTQECHAALAAAETH